MQAGATQQVATLLSALTLSNAKLSSHVLVTGTVLPLLYDTFGKRENHHVIEVSQI